MDALTLLVQQIDEKVGQLKNYLAEGRVATFDEYKTLCGEIRGLLITRGNILDLKENLESSDE